MKNDNTADLRKKILKGIELAFRKLLLEKKRDDAELVFSKDGEIVKIKARDIEFNPEA